MIDAIIVISVALCTWHFYLLSCNHVNHRSPAQIGSHLSLATYCFSFLLIFLLCFSNKTRVQWVEVITPPMLAPTT